MSKNKRGQAKRPRPSAFQRWLSNCTSPPEISPCHTFNLFGEMSEHTIRIAEGGGPGFMVCELPVCVGPTIWNSDGIIMGSQLMHYVKRAVVIRCVKKGSHASAAGLMGGDVLLRSLSTSSSRSVDAMSYNDFVDLVKKKKNGPLVLYVLRIQLENNVTKRRKEKNAKQLPGIKQLLLRCSRSCGWANAFAERVFRSYIQFLELKAIASDWDGKMLYPPIPVEEMWRQHCWDIRSYYQLCSNICKRRDWSIDYNPDAWLKMDNETMRRQQKETVERLYEYFEDDAIDKEIWSCGFEATVDDSNRNKIVSVMPISVEVEESAVVAPPVDATEDSAISKALNPACKQFSNTRTSKLHGDNPRNQSVSNNKRKKEEKEDKKKRQKICGGKQALSIAQVVERLKTNEDQDDSKTGNRKISDAMSSKTIGSDFVGDAPTARVLVPPLNTRNRDEKKNMGMRMDFMRQKNNSTVEKKMDNMQHSEAPKTTSNVSRTQGGGQAKNVGQENITTESNCKNNNISDTNPNHKVVECTSKEQNKNVSNGGSTRQEINRPDSVHPRNSVVKKGSAIRSLSEDPAFANNTGSFDDRMNASVERTEAELAPKINEKRPVAKMKLCDVKNNERGSQTGEQSGSSKSRTNCDNIKSRERGNIICFAVSFKDMFMDYECTPSCAIHEIKIDLVKQCRVDIDSQLLRLNKRVIKDGTVLSNGIKNGDVLRLNKL